MKRTARSSHELERVEVMGRVGSGDLKLSDAAVMLELSYRQAKRLWRRYRQEGSQGLKHENAGRPSNRGKPIKFRRRVLSLIKKIFGFRRGEIRPDLSGRALGRRRWHRAGSRHRTTLDVGRGTVEPATEAQETPPTKGAQGSLRRTGATGREFPRLVGRSWSAGLPDEYGGRCHERNAGSSGQRRDDLGGSRGVAGLD